jgi:hypothetical protein
MLKTTYLNIADFQIELKADAALNIFLENGYENFVAEKTLEKSDISIEVFEGFENELLADKKTLYTAIMGNMPLWNISEWENGYRFIVYDQEFSKKIQHVALVDKNYKHWKIYTLPLKNENGEKGLCPLFYPMGPLIMYYFTVNSDAIMIHASGIFDGEKGRIFSGFSGVGKSTMGNIWKDKGSLLVNDDRLIIRKIDNSYKIYNTPMFYTDDSKNALLSTVFLPYHHPENKAEKLNGIKAVVSIFAYCIQHGYDKNILNHHLNFLSEMCQQLSVFKLGFVPNYEVIDFIKKIESTH